MGRFASAPSRVPLRVLCLLVVTLIATEAAGGRTPADDARAGTQPVLYRESRALRLTGFQASLPLYPLAFRMAPRAWISRPRFRLAADGVVEAYYGAGAGGHRWQFNPVSTAQLCVTAYNEFAITRDAEARRYLLATANGLLHRAVRTREGIVWRYAFAQVDFGAAPGWISGMAQGIGAGCLAGAYLVTGRERYILGARRAALAMRAPFGRTGTSVAAGDGRFYEEVAGGGSRPSHILNGMIFALAGVRLLQHADPRPAWRATLAEGIRGVRALVDRYSAPGVSLYDLRLRNPAGVGRYNRTHVGQLLWMLQESSDPRFAETALRFNGYERSFPYSVRAVAAPDRTHPASGIAVTKGTLAGPPGRTVTLWVRFPAPAPLDEVRLIAGDEWTRPASVVVSAAGSETRYAPRSKLIAVRTPRVTAPGVRIDLTPQRGRRITVRLLAFSDRSLRAMSVVPSDLDTLRASLLVLDGRAGTAWSSARRDPWLVLSLAKGEFRALSLTPCAGPAGRVEVSFSTDLIRWTRPADVVLDRPLEVPVPPEAGYVIMQWRGTNACLSGVSGPAPPRSVGESPGGALGGGLPAHDADTLDWGDVDR